MAKLSQDKIEWILNLNATQAQEQIHKLNKENKELENRAKAARAALAKAVPGSQEWKNASDNVSKFNEQIRRNKKEIEELNKRTDNNTKTLKQLRKELKDANREFENTSKATHPERYKELQGRIKSLKDSIDNATQATNNMTSAWSSVAKMKQVVIGVFAGIGYAITENIIGAFKNAFNVITDFESANAKLASVLGVTKDQIAELEKGARKLGATTSYSAAEVTQLQIELAKLGFAKDSILAMEGAVLKFAKAVGTDLASAAAFSGAALRIFGKDASETEDVLATFAVATTKTALDFSKLEASLATVGPVAASFGISLEDCTALLGQLANAGFDASSAATATRNILLNLADANGDLAKALGGPVKTADDLAAGLKVLNEQGVDLAKALELTDKRSVAAFSTFLANAGTLTELRDGITDVTDAFNQMSATAGDTVNGALAGLRSATEELILKIGLSSTGLIKDIITGLTTLVTKVGNFIEWLGKFSTAIKTVAVAIGSYKAVVIIATGATKAWAAISRTAIGIGSTLKAAWFGMTAAIQAYRGKIQEATTATAIFNTTLKAIPWVQVISLVASIVAGLIALASSTSKATSATKELTAAEEEELRAKEKGVQLVADKTAKIKTLVAVAENEKVSLQERKRACDELNRIIPTYNAHIDDTTGKYVAAKEALDDYIESLQKSARLEYYNDLLREASVKAEKARVDLNNIIADAENADEVFAYHLIKNAQNIYVLAKKEVDRVTDLIQNAAEEGVITISTTREPEKTPERPDSKADLAKSQGQINSELARQERERLKAEEEARKESVKAFEKFHADRLAASEAFNSRQHELIQQRVNDGEITEDAAKVYLMSADRDYHQERLGQLEYYLEQVKANETMTADERTATEEKLNGKIAMMRRQTLTDTGNWIQQLREMTEDTTSADGILEQFDRRREGIIGMYAAMLEQANLSEDDITALEDAKNDRLAALDEERRQKLFELAEITGVTWADEYDNELAKLKAMHRQGLISEKQYQKARTKLQADNAKKYFDLYSGQAASMFTAIQDAEIAASDAKYDVLIQQAKNNGEDTTALEEEKENKKLEIQKKYADVNFAIKVSTIVADTAVAIMKAFADLGPIGGAISAALLTATGIAQIAMANSERQKIKNMQPSHTASQTSESVKTPTATRKLTGYSEGGYTGDGERLEVAGVVHKGEYVVPKPIMGDPLVVDAVAMIEAIRRDRMNIGTSVSPTRFADGGHTSPEVQSAASLAMNTSELVEATSDLRDAAKSIRKMRAYVVLRDIEDKQDLQDRARAPFTRNK